ncbi:hypothetical protein EYC80_008027 [Monilinia laxa]|uniref:Rhodopsin domain-containing protein n=1 Tax=Monilinia laxa TaxID=61186 RepID=A0A5N6JTY4_MONLA|nr:hypothetical protein EYC80_008027 [Monilinia laxa]
MLIYPLSRTLHLRLGFLHWLFALSISFRDTARHGWDIPLSAVLNPSFAKRIFAFKVLSSPTFGFSKAAIIFLYLRVFSPKEGLRWSCYGVLVATLVYWVEIPLTIAWCAPHLHESWNDTVSGICAKIGFTGRMQGAMSVATDLATFIIPLPVIFGLNLSPKRKVGLALVVLPGHCDALVASSVSIYYRVNSYRGINSTWDGPKVTACAEIPSRSKL